MLMNAFRSAGLSLNMMIEWVNALLRIIFGCIPAKLWLPQRLVMLLFLKRVLNFCATNSATKSMYGSLLSDPQKSLSSSMTMSIFVVGGFSLMSVLMSMSVMSVSSFLSWMYLVVKHLMWLFLKSFCQASLCGLFSSVRKGCVLNGLNIRMSSSMFLTSPMLVPARPKLSLSGSATS